MHDELDMLSKRFNNLRVMYDKAMKEERRDEADNLMHEMDTVRDSYLELRNQIGWR